MSGVTWTKFYWSDWKADPALRLCCYAARGLWMDLLSIAADHDPIGYVAVAGRALSATDIARMTGGSEDEVQTLLAELDRNGVFSRDRHSRIYSRRMVRDAKKAAIARKNGKLGGNPSLGKDGGNPASDNPQDNGGVKPQEPTTIIQLPQTTPSETKVSSGAGGRGRRIPDNWLPSPEDVAYASKQGFNAAEILRLADGFRDYWQSRAGKDAARLDWSATWRNRVRDVADRQAASPRPKRVGFV